MHLIIIDTFVDTNFHNTDSKNTRRGNKHKVMIIIIVFQILCINIYM